MENKTQTYGNDSIVSLKGPDRIRLRPGVVFGSDGLDGCEHAAFEIVSNSVDEARAGFGDTIYVTLHPDHVIEVEDDGRGVPMGYNEKEKRYNWDLVFCELYAGGKYNTDEENSAYAYSLGLNGLGACGTQYSSEFMDVYSYTNGECSEMHFKKGYAVGKLKVYPSKPNEKQHGTIIRWKPDLAVFTDIAIPETHFQQMLKRQAIANAGVKFVFQIANEKGEILHQEEFLYPNGILQYVEELAADTAMNAPVIFRGEDEGRDRADQDDYKVKMEAAFCISNTVNVIEYYHNSSWLEYGGAPEKAVRNAFVATIDKYLNASGKYKSEGKGKKEAKITFADVECSLILVTNCSSKRASYENQTKKAITNAFIEKAMTNFLKRNLEAYFAENPMEAEKIAKQILVNKQSRESAEATRKSVRTKLGTAIDITNRVEKFVNCRSRDVAKRELYIVEGDSALTSCKLGRDAEFQAIIPVRGKTLNCMKSSDDKIFASDIIMDLIRVIGCGMEWNGKHKKGVVPFDLNALRWSKIIICTDADEDGFQIRTLLLTMFYRLLPTLLQEGKVFIAESPLFEIATKEETYFAYNEFEKTEILAKLGNTKYTLQRSKGLGENEPEMMWQTTMNPASRRLIQVCPTDAAATAEMFEMLLGDNLQARKEFIALHGSEYYAEADLT